MFVVVEHSDLRSQAVRLQRNENDTWDGTCVLRQFLDVLHVAAPCSRRSRTHDGRSSRHRRSVHRRPLAPSAPKCSVAQLDFSTGASKPGIDRNLATEECK